MVRKVKATNQTADRVALGTADGPAPTADLTLSSAAAPATLTSLAEELGRLLARRELARTGRRPGYSLPELIVGALITVLLWALIGRFLGWLLH